MPHIEEGVKLDFKDVLLRPKRSTLKSRSEVSFLFLQATFDLYFYFKVDLRRNYKFRNSGHEFVGVPLIAANMDTIGTFEMAKALHKVI